ncbi:hypothetical protein RHMOL_Rhmol12G0124500 [Rhododendron molle]|uniref:Uncharacterized protein n=2 Tax=Rhododendron molle TaxID=49168 RepID=A0ACC0LI80_RHOML|nr:hypothetical protein RHMOL_Rhmol12G0124500 [Rhododendron molle]KAI8528093.1 hypothetical protein RHMOL_Rhmol12G0124500 [Rhododendron molle]
MGEKSLSFIFPFHFSFLFFYPSSKQNISMSTTMLLFIYLFIYHHEFNNVDSEFGRLLLRLLVMYPLIASNEGFYPKMSKKRPSVPILDPIGPDEYVIGAHFISLASPLCMS